jgi:hypothetical protein
MASVATDDGRVLNSDPMWKCWVPAGQEGSDGHRTLDPPDGWNQPGFDDSSWPNAVSFGFNTDPTTHWYPYIRPSDVDAVGSQRGGNRNGLAAGVQDKTCDDCVGAIGGGVTDEAQWIWTVELDAHNDVFCRGVLDDSQPAVVDLNVGDFDLMGSNAQGEKQIGGSGGSLEPPGPLLEPPGPLLTHLHTVYMAYSECLPNHLTPLAKTTCFSQVTPRWTVTSCR